MIQQPLCHGLNFVLLFERWEHNIRMENYFEIYRNFEMPNYQFHAIKFYFFFFIHEDTFIIEGIHFKLHWLLSHIVLLVVEIFVTVACRLYNLFMPVPFWSVWLHSATPFIFFFNTVHSAMSEMHQSLALQFQWTVMTCQGRLPARLLAIMFEIFRGLFSESRQIPGQ